METALTKRRGGQVLRRPACPCLTRRASSLNVLFLTFIMFTLPIDVEAQQAGKVYRIGWLAPASLPTSLDAFRDGLRVFGYVEGNNLVIEQRYASGKSELLAGLVAELVGPTLMSS